ncbi:hypothetical protein [Blastococcus sp. TF02-8]|uniref:hypothetical protein n=1 Tax=Blastococcus sp. TF02-8 TaxID=2250574 RepID=UPI001F0C5F5D|nr:hypothetical protein [Blastococcus sp. TF02-8]
MSGLAGWLVLATLLAVVLGRGIRLADQRTPGATASFALQAEAAPAARVRRRAVPLPPVGIGLAATAVGLMSIGYVLRLTGATGESARLLSMDAPFSLPRLFVAGLFAVAALAAVAGAARNEGRRTWWLAVGLIAAGIASVKAGGNVHADAMDALADAVGRPAALALSAVLALSVVAVLWVFSRGERRDRRRVLGSLTGYAVASVGLSALSVLAPASLTVTATFVEESGEALAGVAFLVAVLVGVAPRLVLPAEWALRRSADALSLELPEALPGRRAENSAP